MSVDNSSIHLKNQILANSGLKGKALDKLKERLSTMGVQELRAELSRTIAGRGNNDFSRGLQIEHGNTKQTQYKTETFKDEKGNNVTEYYDGEFLVSRETKTVYENGDVSETEVLYENGNPVVVNKNLNGKQIGHTEYEYDTRGYVKAIETNPNGEKRTISLLNVSPDGEWSFSDVMDINIERADGSTVSAYNHDGLVIEQNHFPNGRIVINTYDSDLSEYYKGNGKKVVQLAGDEKGLIKAEYDGRGNTYTYVNAGDGWEKLAKRFNMTVEQLKKANPKVKTLKAGQRILIPADILADAKEFKGVQNPQYAKMVARNAEIKNRITEGIDKKYIDAIQKAGININAETATFFLRLKELNDTQRNNVINVIRYCKSQKINDINQIKAKILEMYPDINLFDSGKIIYPVSDKDKAGIPPYKYINKKPLSVETFITDVLKLNLKSGTGKDLYERLAGIPQEYLNNISSVKFSDMSKMEFSEIISNFKSVGIDIRTEEEIYADEDKKQLLQERQGVPEKEFASQMLANIYENAADMLAQYYDNHGIFDAGTYIEGFKNILGLITPENSTPQQIRALRKKAEEFRNMHYEEPERFKREFKELVGVTYDERGIKSLMTYLSKEDADLNSEEFKKYCFAAFGFRGTEQTEKLIETNQTIGGIGDIVVMLVTMGAASKLKIMGKAAQGTAKALTKTAGKVMAQKATQKTAQVGTSMVMGGVSLGGFTATKETLNNLSNPMREAKHWETWKQTLIASAESFGFGAFGGLLSTTVIAKVADAIEKPALKSAQAVSEAFAKSSRLSGKEVLEASLKSGELKFSGISKMSIEELKTFGKELVQNMPKIATKTASKTGAFTVEIGGFTLYEASLDAIKDLIDPKTGLLPEDMTVESLTAYLGEKFKEQLTNLGTIKGISRFLMMVKGGKMGQQAMMAQLLRESNKLSNVKFERVEFDGHEVYIAELPNGKKMAARSEGEAIALCQTILQMETAEKIAQPQDVKPEEQKPTEEPAQTPIAQDGKPESVAEGNAKSNIIRYEEVVDYKGQKIEFPVTENADGTENIDFTKGRIKNAQGEYDYIEFTTENGFSEKETTPRKTVEGGINPDELTEVAPFARHIVGPEQILLAEKEVKALEQALQARMVDKNSAEEIQLVQNIMNKVTSDNKDIVEIMLADKSISNELILNVLSSLKRPYRVSMPSLFYNPVVSMLLFYGQGFGFIGDVNVKSKLKLSYARKLLTDSRVSKETIPGILQYLEKGNSTIVDTALNSENFDFKFLPVILKNTLSDSMYYINNQKTPSKSRVKFAKSLINNPRFPNDCIADVVYFYDNDNVDKNFVEELCNNSDFPPSQIAPLVGNISHNVTGRGYLFNVRQPNFKQKLAERLVADKNCPKDCIADIMNVIIASQEKLFNQLYADENIPKEELGSILFLEQVKRRNYRNLTFMGKTLVLTSVAAIEEKTLAYLKKYGIDKNKIDELVDQISLEMGMKKANIPTSEENKVQLFKNYISSNSNVEKLVQNLDLNKYQHGIPLKYSRSEFIKDIEHLIRNLNAEDKATVLNYFSLQIENGKMEGFPIIPEKTPVVKDGLLPIIEQVKSKITDFTQNNETTIEDPELKQLFDSVIKGCPEFTAVIGKVQHPTHQYTVDVHTLKVLQNAFNDPEYQKLDDESKTILKFAILLHDIGKKEGVKDKGHYEASAKYAVNIIEKYNLPARVKNRIIETIYNHHWFEQYNKNEISANLVNAIFRTPNDLKIGMLMAKADLMGVSDDFHFVITRTHNIRALNEFFDKKEDELSLQQHARYKNANLVMDTKFVQTDNRRFPTQTVMIKGKPHEIPVLNLTDETLPDDLFEFGFAKGVTRKSARFFAHFNDRIRGLKVFMALSSSPTIESVQSLSMISLDNSRTYRHQIYGVITDVDMANIAQASNENISSGYRKDLKNFSKDLFGFFQVNTFVRDCLIDELDKASIKLTKEEYGQLAEKIVDIQYETQVTEDIKVGDKTIPAELLQNALKASRDRLFNGSLNSEIVAINPRVKALVARVSSIEECSQEFLELAAKNNLPIILIGHNERALTSDNSKVEAVVPSDAHTATDKPEAQNPTPETPDLTPERASESLAQRYSQIREKSERSAKPFFTDEEFAQYDELSQQRIVELSEITYTKDGATYNAFSKNGIKTVLEEIAESGEGYFERLKGIAQIKDAEGNNMFNSSSAMNIAFNENIDADKIIKLLKIQRTSAKGEVEQMFPAEFWQYNINDSYAILSMKFDDVIRLSKLTYTDANGKQSTMFGACEIAGMRDKNIDNVVNLAGLTYTNKEGKVVSKLTPDNVILCANSDFEKVKILLELTDNKGNFILNGMAAYSLAEKDSETVRNLFGLLDKDGKRILDSGEVYSLADCDFEKVRTLLEYTDTDGYPRFEGYEVLKLLEKDFDKVKTIIELEGKDHKPRINEVRDILELADKNIDVIKYLAELKDKDGNFRFNYKQLLLAPEDINVVKYLAELKDKDGNPRLEDFQINALADKDINVIRYLAELKDKDGNPRLKGSDIVKLADKNIDTIKYLAELKDKEGNYRLDRGDIVELADKDINVIKYLAELKDKDGNPRISAYHMDSLSGKIFDKVKYLAELTDRDGNPRLRDVDISFFVENNFDDVKYLAEQKDREGNPRFSTNNMRILIKRDMDKIKHLVGMTDDNGNQKFDGNQITALIDIDLNEMDKYEFAVHNFLFFDSKSLKETVADYGDKLEKIKQSIESQRKERDIPDTKCIIAKRDDMSVLDKGSKNLGDDLFIRVVDETGFVYKFDKATCELVALSSPETTIDYKDNTWSTVSVMSEDKLNKNKKAEESSEQKAHVEFVKGKTPVNIDYYIKNKTTGEQITHEQMLESKDIKGNFEIWSYAPNGEKYLVGLAELDGLGGRHVEKHLTSLDGTVTDMVFADDVEGNNFMYYKITDKSGNILFETTKKHKVIDENHYQTFTDDEGYDIQFTNDKIIITALDENNNKTSEFIEYNIVDFDDKKIGVIISNIGNQIVEDILNEAGIPLYTVDRRLVPLLKRISGEEWGKLYSSQTMLLLGGYIEKNNAGSVGGICVFGEETYNELSIMLHEAGHERFDDLNLYEDEMLFSIYNEEKNLYTRTFPDGMIAPIEYFLFANNITDPKLSSSQRKRGLNETAAETNAILSVPQEDDVLQARTALLQQYFPRTIAYIANRTKLGAEPTPEKNPISSTGKAEMHNHMPTSSQSEVEQPIQATKALRTTEESIAILKNKAYAKYKDETIESLNQYEDIINSLPENVLIKLSPNLLKNLAENWIPEFEKIPFDKIPTGVLNTYVKTLLNNPEYAQLKTNSILQVVIPDVESENTVSFFLFTDLKTEDGKFDINKVVNYLENLRVKVPHVENTKVFGELYSILANESSIQTFAQKYPKTLSLLMNDLEKYNWVQVDKNRKISSESLEYIEKYLDNDYPPESFPIIQTCAELSQKGYTGSPITLSKKFKFMKELAIQEFSIGLQDKILDKVLELQNTEQEKVNVIKMVTILVHDEKVIENLISSPEYFNKFCDDCNYRKKKLTNNNKYRTQNIFSIAITIELMKRYNRKSYDNLVLSQGYKEIIAGNINPDILSSISYKTQIDENFFYDLYEEIETNNNRQLELECFQKYDKEQINKIIELDPAKSDDIISWISTAPDAEIMNYIINVINCRISKAEIQKTEIQKQGSFILPMKYTESNNKLLDLLRYANEEPELVKKVSGFSGTVYAYANIIKTIKASKLQPEVLDKVIDIYKKFDKPQLADLCQGVKFMAKFNDLELLNNLKQSYGNNMTEILKNTTENNIDYLREKVNNKTLNNDMIWMLQHTKNIPEFKDPDKRQQVLDDIYEVLGANDYIKELREVENTILNTQTPPKELYEKRANLVKKFNSTKIAFYYSGLVDMKIHNPEMYDKIKASGFLDLVESGRLPLKSIRNLNRNSDLTPQIYADLEALKEGRSIILEFSAGTPVEEAFSKTQIGDAVAIGKKMYINDGNSLVEWNMTKEKYLELFPPVLRFTSCQNTLGNCYFATSLFSSMEDRYARPNIYKSFELKGDDVVVTVKAYEDYNGSYTYKNGNIELPTTEDYMSGCKGLQMYEQAYARTTLRVDYMDHLPKISQDMNPQAIMQRIIGGRAFEAMGEIHGIDNIKRKPNGDNTDLALDIPETGRFSAGLKYDNNTPDAISKFEQYIEQFVKPGSMLKFGTISKSNEDSESNLLSEYNLISNHAYSIYGYDKSDGTVLISNPHNASIITKIPVSILVKYIAQLNATRF